MNSYVTEYQDRFWDYNNPIAIENDEFEQLVMSRLDVYGTVKKHKPRTSNLLQPKKQTKKVIDNKPIQVQHDPKLAPGKKQKTIVLKKNQSTFVSSETKPLKKQPRVHLHWPSPAAASIRYEDEALAD